VGRCRGFEQLSRQERVRSVKEIEERYQTGHFESISDVEMHIGNQRFQNSVKDRSGMEIATRVFSHPFIELFMSKGEDFIGLGKNI
jgi:hypothetical protein